MDTNFNSVEPNYKAELRFGKVQGFPAWFSSKSESSSYFHFVHITKLSTRLILLYIMYFINRTSLSTCFPDHHVPVDNVKHLQTIFRERSHSKRYWSIYLPKHWINARSSFYMTKNIFCLFKEHSKTSVSLNCLVRCRKKFAMSAGSVLSATTNVLSLAEQIHKHLWNEMIEKKYGRRQAKLRENKTAIKTANFPWHRNWIQKKSELDLKMKFVTTCDLFLADKLTETLSPRNR